ncbi:lipid-A-disaccharide synthase [Zoogloea sp.]|jgi:lipid-A-disaccharide synthase|uniref:lipid-A-disaccharide synthase n=1 Tax=Zoogloea sp. TaxID=49181 RepID=UPI0037DA44BF
MALRIAMVAGEASSDLLASHLIRALKRHLPDAEFFGIGGPKMQAEGFKALWPAEKLAVHGYVDALKNYRELSGIRRTLLKRLLADPPAAFIGVDAPDFSLWLEKRLKDKHIPAIHFVGPSIWAWRKGRIKGIARSVSHMLCLFPFEPPLYQAAGVPVSYVGHPLADVFPLAPDRAAAREMLQIPDGVPVFALLPGSRQSEVRNLADTYIATAAALHERHPDARFLVPLATRETRLLFEEALRRHANIDLPIRILFGHAVDAMIAADVVLVASGTATLEAALLKRPMVITYKMGKWSFRLMRRMAYLPWVGLPNVLAGREVVPEILQDAATPQALADALDAWLTDKEKVAELTRTFTDMHLQLRQDTAAKAAAAILPYLQGRGR